MLDPNKALKGEKDMAKAWTDHANHPPTREVYEQSVAEQWHNTGCATDGAPYILRALLSRLSGMYLSQFAKDSPEVPKLAADFLKPDCEGARGLTDAEIAKLKAISSRAPPAAPPAPKP